MRRFVTDLEGSAGCGGLSRGMVPVVMTAAGADALIDLVATTSLCSLATIRGTMQILELEMGTGRLIRVEKYRSDPNAVAYIVAIADPDEAIALIRKKAAAADDEIRDMGRVSDALLNSLKLQAGEFIRADASRGAPPADTII